MGKILDYDEMNDLLGKLKNIKKEKPIGYTYFGLPIDHYVYGRGDITLLLLVVLIVRSLLVMFL